MKEAEQEALVDELVTVAEAEAALLVLGTLLRWEAQPTADSPTREYGRTPEGLVYQIWLARTRYVIRGWTPRGRRRGGAINLEEEIFHTSSCAAAKIACDIHYTTGEWSPPEQIILDSLNKTDE